MNQHTVCSHIPHVRANTIVVTPPLQAVPTIDVGTDVGTDVGIDAYTDAAIDTYTDASIDAVTDIGTDAYTDASIDTPFKAL